MSQAKPYVISVMLAVADAPAAVRWYKEALGATDLWSLGSVAGLEINGAAFFVGQPENNGWETPVNLGITTTRIEVFCDEPDSFIEKALTAGATVSTEIRDHDAPWGTHRQGSFVDPFGHKWLVGDRSPLAKCL
jgi:PhnB protein